MSTLTVMGISGWSGAALGWGIVALILFGIATLLILVGIYQGIRKEKEWWMPILIAAFPIFLGGVIYGASWDAHDSAVETAGARAAVENCGYEVNELDTTFGWVLVIEDGNPTEYGLAEYRDEWFVLDPGQPTLPCPKHEKG